MANYTVSAGDNGTEPWTTVADQVDTVTFTDDVQRVEIVSNGGAEVRVSNTGADPTIGSAGASTPAYRLPAGIVSSIQLPMPKDVDSLKVMSPGVASVSVSIPR